jgi:hypothetical protein
MRSFDLAGHTDAVMLTVDVVPAVALPLDRFRVAVLVTVYVPVENDEMSEATFTCRS